MPPAAKAVPNSILISSDLVFPATRRKTHEGGHQDHRYDVGLITVIIRAAALGADERGFGPALRVLTRKLLA